MVAVVSIVWRLDLHLSMPMTNKVVGASSISGCGEVYSIYLCVIKYVKDGKSMGFYMGTLVCLPIKLITAR